MEQAAYIVENSGILYFILVYAGKLILKRKFEIVYGYLLNGVISAIGEVHGINGLMT
jgi:hypothetical protein